MHEMMVNKKRTNLSRRQALALLSAGSVFLPSRHLAASLIDGSRAAFDVVRGSDNIGSHVISFARDGADLLVDVQIELAVKFAFLTIFRYSHRNRERWRGGRLISLDSETNDDGTPYTLSVRAESKGLRVDGDEGSFLAPADLLPTSYWNPRTVTQTRLLDSQRGRILEVETAKAGQEKLPAPLGPTEARLYRMAGDLNLDLWYGPADELLKLAFEARGATVEYRVLETARPETV